MVESADGDGIRAEVLGDGESERPVGTAAVRLVNARAVDNDSDDVQLEAAGGSLTIQGGEVGRIDLADGIDRVEE